MELTIDLLNAENMMAMSAPRAKVSDVIHLICCFPQAETPAVTVARPQTLQTTLRWLTYHVSFAIHPSAAVGGGAGLLFSDSLMGTSP